MIYNSIHTIPSRLFFKIVETGDYTLLDSDDIKDELEKALKEENHKEVEKLTSRLKNLESVWIDLQEADQKLSSNKKTEKFLNTSKSIESLKCQQKKVELAVTYLRIKVDVELIAMLKEEGYEFSKDFDADLDRIEKLNHDLSAKIKRLELTLPKPKKNKEVPFDDLVIGYAMIAGQTWKANEITQSEFRGLENNVKLKIESLPKNGR